MLYTRFYRLGNKFSLLAISHCNQRLHHNIGFDRFRESDYKDPVLPAFLSLLCCPHILPEHVKTRS